MDERIRGLEVALREHGYVADRALATVLHLTIEMGKPLLVEGPAGVGKTEVAKAMATVLDTRLIRLQCYEGLDASMALYEWNYPRQMLAMAGQPSLVQGHEEMIFTEKYLLKRPLLEALMEPVKAPVLLLDEIDRADEEFEAFLLEVLSDFQITIPELGTISAAHRPHVILTSNRTRELSDALTRRCAYHWIPFPSYAKELDILRLRLPNIEATLAAQIVGFVQVMRRLSLRKVPGTAETLDWATSLILLHADWLDAELIEVTLGELLKDREDIFATSRLRVERIVETINALGTVAEISGMANESLWDDIAIQTLEVAS